MENSRLQNNNPSQVYFCLSVSGLYLSDDGDYADDDEYLENKSSVVLIT